MDRKTFFKSIRGNPLGRLLTQEQVDGISRILDEWEAHWAHHDIRCLAYILATAFHETDGSFAPVREGSVGGKRLTDAQARVYILKRGYKYGVVLGGHMYYGRGLVQLTWIGNYRKMATALGVDLVNNPELACDPEIAVKVLFEGMFRGKTGKGDFTGKALEDYFSKEIPRGDLATVERARARNARRIVNGTDKADLIAGYFLGFIRALDAAKAVAGETVVQNIARLDQIPEAPEEVVDKGASPAISNTVLASAGAAISAAIPGAAGAIFGINSPWAFAAFSVVAIALVVLVFIFRKQIAYRAGV